MNVCECVCAYVYIYMCVCVCECACVCMYACVQVCVQVSTKKAWRSRTGRRERVTTPATYENLWFRSLRGKGTGARLRTDGGKADAGVNFPPVQRAMRRDEHMCA
jgi:hypothetical protein